MLAMELEFLCRLVDNLSFFLFFFRYSSLEDILSMMEHFQFKICGSAC